MLHNYVYVLQNLRRNISFNKREWKKFAIPSVCGECYMANVQIGVYIIFPLFIQKNILDKTISLAITEKERGVSLRLRKTFWCNYIRRYHLCLLRDLLLTRKPIAMSRLVYESVARNFSYVQRVRL